MSGHTKEVVAKFIVKVFNYVNEELRVISVEFKELGEAIEHGLLHPHCNYFKVYDHEGVLRFSSHHEHEHEHEHGHHEHGDDDNNHHSPY